MVGDQKIDQKYYNVKKAKTEKQKKLRNNQKMNQHKGHPSNRPKVQRRR